MIAVWSNSSSGIAYAASGAISCCALASTGGERAGAIAGAVFGSPATSPNSDAPLDTPHSVPAAGGHTPRPASIANYNRRVPLDRMLANEDIKGAVVFLASDANGYVAGHPLLVDGRCTAL